MECNSENGDTNLYRYAFYRMKVYIVIIVSVESLFVHSLSFEFRISSTRDFPVDIVIFTKRWRVGFYQLVGDVRLHIIVCNTSYIIALWWIRIKTASVQEKQSWKYKTIATIVGRGDPNSKCLLLRTPTAGRLTFPVVFSAWLIVSCPGDNQKH